MKKLEHVQLFEDFTKNLNENKFNIIFYDEDYLSYIKKELTKTNFKNLKIQDFNSKEIHVEFDFDFDGESQVKKHHTYIGIYIDNDFKNGSIILTSYDNNITLDSQSYEFNEDPYSPEALIDILKNHLLVDYNLPQIPNLIDYLDDNKKINDYTKYWIKRFEKEPFLINNFPKNILKLFPNEILKKYNHILNANDFGLI